MEERFFEEGQFIVHLIDTPSFGDTTKSDVETLQEVANW